MSTLDERIAEASVEVAKTAIANPNLFPQWRRLCRAKEKIRAAAAELDMAQRVWDSLIEAAPPEWKKLAPIPE